MPADREVESEPIRVDPLLCKLSQALANVLDVVGVGHPEPRISRPDHREVRRSTRELVSYGSAQPKFRFG